MGGDDRPDHPERFSGSQELEIFLERVRVDWAGLSKLARVVLAEYWGEITSTKC